MKYEEAFQKAKEIVYEDCNNGQDIPSLIDIITELLMKQAGIYSNVSGKRPTVPSIEEVIKTLDLAQCEIRAFYKRFNYQDSNVLRQIDSVHEALKAACATVKGGPAED